MMATDRPKGSRWQLIAASALLMLWIVVLAWMAIYG
jgi:hypothetical protein